MKRILTMLICAMVILMPIKIEAKSYKFNYYCDAKQKLDDKTFYKVCHIAITTDFNINHIQGNLILKNLKLEDIRTNGDWTNNNGLSINVDFTSKTSHKGTIEVADLVFTGNLSDTECLANFEPLVAEETNPEPKVCVIEGNTYYGKDGKVVTKEEYNKECNKEEPKVCVVEGNTYYGKDGKVVTKEEYNKECNKEEPKVCVVEGNTYYGKDGNVVTKEEYNKECNKEEPKTCVVIDDEYYGKDGTKVTEEKYYEQCFKYICTVVDNKYYYDHNGKAVSYDQFVKDCSEVETPQTGVNYGYIILPLGIASIIAIVKTAKKNTKIYKI